MLRMNHIVDFPPLTDDEILVLDDIMSDDVDSETEAELVRKVRAAAAKIRAERYAEKRSA